MQPLFEADSVEVLAAGHVTQFESEKEARGNGLPRAQTDDAGGDRGLYPMSYLFGVGCGGFAGGQTLPDGR